MERIFYYGDHERRGNRDWSGLGCSGEIRSAKGYCILHGDGLHRVAKAIESGVQFDLFPFPEELLEIARATLVNTRPGDVSGCDATAGRCKPSTRIGIERRKAHVAIRRCSFVGLPATQRGPI